jgi:hypothetical protein
VSMHPPDPFSTTKIRFVVSNRTTEDDCLATPAQLPHKMSMSSSRQSSPTVSEDFVRHGFSPFITSGVAEAFVSIIRLRNQRLMLDEWVSCRDKSR